LRWPWSNSFNFSSHSLFSSHRGISSIRSITYLAPLCGCSHPHFTSSSLSHSQSSSSSSHSPSSSKSSAVSSSSERPKDIADLLEGNRRWVEHTTSHDPEFFKKFAKGQSPQFLYVGCSDSRVPANIITGTHPNEMFVHRNVANLVVSNDLNFLTVLHYAVEVLKVSHIIVTGHYDCGGVRAAMRTQDHGILENWLCNIRDVYRLHYDELEAIGDIEQRTRRLVELNVMEQCLNIFKIGVVQRKRLETHLNKSDINNFATPRIHGLVFDPADGILKHLNINWKDAMNKHRKVYDLYEVPSKG